MFSKNKTIKIMNCLKTNNFDADTIQFSSSYFADDNKAFDLLKNLFIEKAYFISKDNSEDKEIKLDVFSYFEKNNRGIQFFVYIPKFDTSYQMYLDFSDFSLNISGETDKIEKSEKGVFKEIISNTGRLVIGELAYVNLLIHHQEVNIEEISTEKRVSVSSNKKKNRNNKKTKTVRTINISENTVKRVYKKSNDDNTEKREYIRQVQSWTVRGYWRTYKSGKKVWIEPQTRRAKNSNSKGKNRKNYIIKE